MDRQANKAIVNYSSNIQKIVSCISQEVCWYKPKGAEDFAVGISRQNTLNSIKLKSSTGAIIFLSAVETMKWTLDNELVVSAYAYSVSDSNGKELLSFHCHPEQQLPDTSLHHIHIKAHKDETFSALKIPESHVPSGGVSLADIVRWLISELNIVVNRSDWQTILGGS